jgi:hypothetical protein
MPTKTRGKRVYGDFAELQTSMDALGERASRIHDSIIGLLGVVNNEQVSQSTKAAGRLNIMGAVCGVSNFAFHPDSRLLRKSQLPIQS